MGFCNWCKMMKHKCLAYTKKKQPCRNFATEGSHFCDFHEGLFKDCPPVKITALICPYCEKPLRKPAKACKFCKNFFLICPYCDEPLRKDANSCIFCKEVLTTVMPEPTKINYYDKLIDIRDRITAKDLNIRHKFLIAAIFLFLTLYAYIFSMDLYLMLDNLWGQ